VSDKERNDMLESLNLTQLAELAAICLEISLEKLEDLES